MIADSRVSCCYRAQRRAWALLAMALGLIVAFGTLGLLQSHTLAAPAEASAGSPAASPPRDELPRWGWLWLALPERFAQALTPVDGASMSGTGFRGLLNDAGLATSPTAIVVVDDGGPDDEPGQKDLNFLIVDYGPVPDPDSLEIAWAWDDTAWSGTNTGDGCVLFDTNDNGNADYALCVTVAGTPATFQHSTLYSCGDDRADRCSQPVSVMSITGSTTCDAAVFADVDPFGTEGSEYFDPAHTGQVCKETPGCYTDDTVAQCTVDFFDVGGEDAKLVNVCAYPSAEPNSSPSDCVFTPNSGFLTVVKEADPDDGTAFDFTSSAASRSGDSQWTIFGSGSVQLISFAPGTYDLTELVPQGWQLNSASCAINGTPTGDFDDTSTIEGLAIEAGLETICTFSDVAQGALTVEKVLIGREPDSDWAFTGDLDTFLIEAGGGSRSFSDLAPGTYTVTETIKDGYDVEITCDNTHTVSSTTVSVQLDPGANVTCVFTNTRVAAQLTLEPESAVNRAGEDHVLTATLLLDTNGDGLYETPGADEVITFTVVGDGNLSADICTTGSAGWCTVTLQAPAASGTGTSTVEAQWEGNVGLATLTVESNEAHKIWRDLRLALEPDEDVNAVGDHHVFTATLESDTGTGWTGVSGEEIAFTTSGVGFLDPASCTTDASGQCTVTLTSDIGGTTYVTATFDGQVDFLSFEVSDTAEKTWVDASIQLDPLSATNEVSDPHTITATVQVHDGTSWRDAPDGTVVSFTLSGGAAAFVGEPTCQTSAGVCAVQINATSAGVVIIHAGADVSVGGLVLRRQTDGLAFNSDPAEKTYVDAQINIEPLMATNEVSDPHTITATVQVHDGVSWRDAPDGTVVSFTLSGGAAAFVGEPTCQTNAGVCAVQINATSAGVVIIHAGADVSVGGLVLRRQTDGVGLNSDAAEKTYVDASIAIGPEHATNALFHEHVFTVTVSLDEGSGLEPIAGVTPTVLVEPMPNSFDDSDCADGTDHRGQCIVVINSPYTGTFTANATVTITVQGVTLVRSTAGTSGPAGSGPATKVYAQAAIAVEKSVSVDGQDTWQDADDPTGPHAQAGSDVYFRFLVRNTGDLILTNVTLMDSDFDLSGCTIPDVLPPGDTFQCIVGPVTAIVGQHVNTATATGDYAGETYQDTNDAHYFGVQAQYAFDKLINGQHANTLQEAVEVEAGDVLTFTYVVTNTGNVPIAWTRLTDDVFGDLTTHCGLPVEIPVGGSAGCEYVSEAGQAEDGMRNIGTASVQGLDDQTDPAWYKTPEPTAITLLDFRVQAAGGSAVGLTWKVLIEIENVAYRIYRAAHPQGAQDLVAHVPGVAYGLPLEYSYVDTVPAAGFWTYWLMAVDSSGAETTLHRPVRVGVNVPSLYLPLILKH